MGKSEAPWLNSVAVECGRLRRRAQPLLGTLVEVALQLDSDRAFEHASNAAFEVIAEVHRAMSFHDSRSDVRCISRAAPGTVLSVNPHTWKVLYLARRMELDSGGLFNVAVAPALVARGLLPQPVDAPTPTARSVADSLALLSEHRVRVSQPLWVDLGGIAKGYAVDCAVQHLQALGVRAGLVNAGGDMRAFGALTHLVFLRFHDRLMQVASLQNSALASSCSAELSPHKTPHIDPRTGSSACSTNTVVVQARSAAVADALTKVALLCPATADKLCAELDADWRPFLRTTRRVH
jgi:FAD:protein FMN transferase